MPYERLPARLRQLIPSEHGQNLFRNVFNSQMESGKRESVAFASAWAALERAGYKKDPKTGVYSRVEKSRDSTLQDKVDEYNEKYGAKHGKVSLGMLRDVYDRGIGAYRTNPESVRPNVRSKEQWAWARVSSFLSAARGAKAINHDKDIHDKIKKSQPSSSSVHVPSTDWEKADTYRPPAGARAAARRAIRWKEKYGDKVKGGTQVGWTRAGQLARGENLSRETVARMASFFARHRGNEKVDPKYKDEPWRDAGFTSFLIWGGSAGREWSQRIMDRLKKRVDLDPLAIKSGVPTNRVENPSDIFSSADDDLGPSLAVFSLKANVASVSKKAELLGTPFFCTDAGGDTESLLIVPLSKVSIPVEPSSDVMWNEVSGEFWGDEVVCLVRDGTPASKIINNMHTGNPYGSIRKFTPSTWFANANISKEANIISKLIDVLNISGGKSKDFASSGTDASVGKNKTSPISSDWAVPLEKIFVPIDSDIGSYPHAPRAVLSGNTLIFNKSADSIDSAPQSRGDLSGANAFSVEINDFAFLNFGKGVFSPATSFSDNTGIVKNNGYGHVLNSEVSSGFEQGVTSSVKLDNLLAGVFRNVLGHVGYNALGGGMSQLLKRQVEDDMFTTPAEAVVRSMDLGLEGEIHVHEKDGQAVYMPGEDHEDYLERIREIAGIESDDSEAVKEGLLERAISAIIGAIMQQVSVNKSQKEATVLKVDDEQGLVYGWAYVSTEDGNLLVDSQGDSIEPIEMEKMATNFMLNSRNAKVMHKGENVGQFVHSFPMTNDIMKAFDIYSDREGWIVAMKPDNEDVMKAYKSGKYTGFSIGGKAGDVEEYDAA